MKKKRMRIAKAPLAIQSYHTYIKSAAWVRRRHAYLRHIRKSGVSGCEVCDSLDGLSVHHVRYDNLGNEKNADLLAVCRSCHTQIHIIEKTHNISVASATNLHCFDRCGFSLEGVRQRLKLQRPALVEVTQDEITLLLDVITTQDIVELRDFANRIYQKSVNKNNA